MAVEGYLLMGDVLLHSGHAADALAEFERAFAIGPSSRIAIRRFHARRAGEQLEAGLSELRAWVETNPQDRHARRVLGIGYLEAGRLAEAGREHEQLAASDPEDFGVLNNLAWIYATTGDSRAGGLAAAALELAPEHPAVLDTYGWILVQNGSHDEGLEYLREAHSRASESSVILYHLGVALHRLGRDDEARQELEAALERGDFRGAAEARALLERL